MELERWQARVHLNFCFRACSFLLRAGFVLSHRRSVMHHVGGLLRGKR